MCPVRVPRITRPPSMVGEADMAPRPSPCQIRVPELARYAATTPPPLAATTIPPATAGGPFTAPLISTCHAGFRCFAPSTLSVAVVGCPSRAQSPRYIGQCPPAVGEGEGEQSGPPPPPGSSTTTKAAPAAARNLMAA